MKYLMANYSKVRLLVQSLGRNKEYWPGLKHLRFCSCPWRVQVLVPGRALGGGESEVSLCCFFCFSRLIVFASGKMLHVQPPFCTIPLWLHPSCPVPPGPPHYQKCCSEEFSLFISPA